MPEPKLPGAGRPRVLKAFEQVHAHLRELILSGELARGQRLPTEVALAAHFGVSRGTVREALRLLVSDGLVRTAKGTGGGSYVTLPTVDHLSEFMERNIELLTAVDDVTLPEFLEARELIEVYAVRRAAERRTPGDLERLRETLAEDGSPYEMYLRNKEFHNVLIDVCGNSLLRISAQPIFSVLHTHLARSTLDEAFPRAVCSEHADILSCIEAGDADAAADTMRRHLEYLGGVYRGIWRVT
jgi:DNA-binding FadR family transcriptional regulator